MDGNEFKTWRTANGYTQPGVADLFRYSRATVARWEGGLASVPEDVISKIAASSSPTPPPSTDEPGYSAPKVARLKPAFDPVAAGLQLWGERPPGIPERVLPVGRGWQQCSWRVVHGSIPDPIPFHAPHWAGQDGVVTADGRVFHYRTGDRIHEPSTARVVEARPSYGSLAKKPKGAK